MNDPLSPNTQAILLLTAPLIVGRGAAGVRPLSPDDYSRLAAHLRSIGHKPADFLEQSAEDVIRACQDIVNADQLRRLLERGFLLAQALERWSSRAIWVISRADPQYPRRLKTRLNDAAPAVLYGCGDLRLLDGGGLAVVGSRDADDALLAYSAQIGSFASRSQKAVVSGGARGVDQAAMRGALQSGGCSVGVLADSLENAALDRDHREALLNDRLVLTTPYDPSADFNVAQAMQRNKLIYALADAALVVNADVNADVNQNGTWAGATEQLEKLHYVRVYVRSTGAPSAGLDALRARGAESWPNPNTAGEFNAVLGALAPSTAAPAQVELALASEAPKKRGAT
jgi:predicted Rossmann fold nucleotide-binding protein DprA/Smf involved in DNA uptake